MQEGSQTSIYFNGEDWEVLEKLQSKTGLGRSAVIRMALHHLAESEEGANRIDRLAKIKTAAEEIISLTQA